MSLHVDPATTDTLFRDEVSLDFGGCQAENSDYRSQSYPTCTAIAGKTHLNHHMVLVRSRAMKNLLTVRYMSQQQVSTPVAMPFRDCESCLLLLVEPRWSPIRILVPFGRSYIESWLC